jgi:hypothetical protein
VDPELTQIISEFGRLMADALKTSSLLVGDDAMNLERGVRRITLVVSVVTGLGAWVLSSQTLYDHWCWERQQYLAYKEKHENIDLFWKTWDANGWALYGYDINKNGVLRMLAEVPYRGMTFTTDATDFTLHGYEVLPGMNAAKFDLPATGLATALQKARRDGRWNALFDYVGAETFWTKRTRTQLLAFSVVGGLAIGSATFATVWLLFFLLRWIGRGFFTATGQVLKVGESDDLVLSSLKEPSGAEECQLSVCNSQQHAAEGGKQ